MSVAAVLLADAFLHNLDPNIVQFSDRIAIKWYGLSYVLGFFVTFLLLRLLAKRKIGPLKLDDTSDFVTLGALFGVMLGGRLGFMLFYDFDEFIRSPWIIVQLWKGGMSSHGGIAGMAVFVFVYAWKKGLNAASLSDNLVSVAPLGVLFGRIANFINGELYGKAWNGWCAVKFPAELKEEPDIADRVFAKLPDFRGNVEQLIFAARTDSRIQEVLREELTARHPSQIYQGLMEGLLVFLILFGLRLKFKNLPHGLLAGLFFISYAILRIVGEVFRHADSGYVGALSKGQFYSLFMFLIGGGFIAYAMLRGRQAASAAAGGVKKPQAKG